MGNIESREYPRVPDAILTFGPDSQKLTDLDRSQNLINELNKAAGHVNKILNEAGPFIKLIAAIKSYTGPAGTFIGIVSTLIGKTDELQARIGALETSISMNEVKASLMVLKNIVDILHDPRITSAQLLAEIAFAVHEFHRLLPKFTGDSVLCVKYYLGAPLFVQICALFKVVILFAKNTPDFINPGLGAIVNDYQKSLNSFRIRCIRERCLSIYILRPASGFVGSGDHRDLCQPTLTHFPEYFTETDPLVGIESSEKVRLKHAKHPWFGDNFDHIFDEWDVRKRGEITFGSVEIHKADGLVFTTTFSPREVEFKAIYTYRRNVVNLMEDYFNAANLI